MSLKKLLICFIVVLVGLVFLTGCQKKEKEEEVVPEETISNKAPKENAGKVVIDNDNITIRYIKREYMKISGMKDNKVTSYKLPSMLFNITNKLDEKIHFEVRASKNVGDKLNYSYSLTNADRTIDTSGTILNAKEKQDVNVIYQKTKDLEEEYSLDVFDNTKIYLSLYKYGSSGETVLVKEYEIDTSKLN